MRGGQPRNMITTVLDGLQNIVPANWKVTYAKGCDITNLVDDTSKKFADGQVCPKIHVVAQPDSAMIATAVQTAEAADYAVVVIGDDLPLTGEWRCTATLELQGGQLALLEALAKTKTPLIIVLIQSKPMVLPPSVENAAAIIELFNPGMCGGQALAEAIFGQFNPSGKLTISFPRHVGQQPVFYNIVRGQHGDRYADLTQEPLFAFGEGLSFTTYRYSNLQVKTPTIHMNEEMECMVDITNTGSREGTEIAQLYISDCITSATWVEKELKAFQRVQLKPGETKTLYFKIPASSLSIVNTREERVVEPGEFEILVGPDSRNRNLLKAIFQVVK
jgi:beta-glucosidase